MGAVYISNRFRISCANLQPIFSWVLSLVRATCPDAKQRRAVGKQGWRRGPTFGIPRGTIPGTVQVGWTAVARLVRSVAARSVTALFVRPCARRRGSADTTPLPVAFAGQWDSGAQSEHAR